MEERQRKEEQIRIEKEKERQRKEEQIRIEKEKERQRKEEIKCEIKEEKPEIKTEVLISDIKEFKDEKNKGSPIILKKKVTLSTIFKSPSPKKDKSKGKEDNKNIELNHKSDIINQTEKEEKKEIK